MTMTMHRYMTPGRLLFPAFLGFLLLGAVGCNDDGETPDEVATGDEGAAEHGEAAEGVVQLDSTSVEYGNIRIGAVETVTTTGLPVTGTITYHANRVSHIGPRTDGRIVRLDADVGTRVTAGRVLAVLESPQIGQLQTEEREAQALLKIARENHAREQRLEQQGISSRKELLVAEADLRRAEAALNSAHERLLVLGAHDGEGGRFVVTTPFAGVVVARDASLGEMAVPADQLFTVANLDRLWIELDIFERDLARIARGQDVEITTAAYPGRAFPGTIVYIGDILDPQKRTVRARVEVPNPRELLKPGMFATARIAVGGGGEPFVVVPEAAVQELEGQKVVFVPGDRPGEFRAQAVEVGEQLEGGKVVILSGLTGDSRIVVTGAFSLRSELAEGEIGEHGH